METKTKRIKRKPNEAEKRGVKESFIESNILWGWEIISTKDTGGFKKKNNK